MKFRVCVLHFVFVLVLMCFEVFSEFLCYLLDAFYKLGLQNCFWAQSLLARWASNEFPYNSRISQEFHNLYDFHHYDFHHSHSFQQSLSESYYLKLTHPTILQMCIGLLVLISQKWWFQHLIVLTSINRNAHLKFQRILIRLGWLNGLS